MILISIKLNHPNARKITKTSENEPKQSKNFPLKECQIGFASRNDLASHTRETHGQEKFACEICNKENQF